MQDQTAGRPAPVERVRSRLEASGRRIINDRRHEFMAQCPAHDDRTPSLHVSTSDDGWGLVNCLAGCEVHDVLAVLNLDLADLFPQPNARVRTRGARKQGGKEARSKGTADVTVKDRGSRGTASSGKTDDAIGAVEELLAMEEAGTAEPAPVRLALPEDASEPMKWVAGFFERVLALRRWADLPDADEVPFAYRWVAGHVGLPERVTWQAIARLRSAGVLEGAGELERRAGQPRGTLLFRPGR
jgi:hypothetical protein